MFSNCILYNVKKFERELSRIIEEEFNELGMHHTYAYILTFVAAHDYVKTKDIASTLNLSSSTVTRMITKLEDDNLIIKGSENSPVDISLSDSGREFMPLINDAWNRYHERCAKEFDIEQITALQANLKQINNK